MLNVTVHKVVTGLRRVEAILCPKNFNVCYFNAFRSVKLTFIVYCLCLCIFKLTYFGLSRRCYVCEWSGMLVYC